MARVPRQLTGAASVALTDEEEHTLSAVDGTLDERALALVTGTDPAELAEQLERLAMMGVIALDGGDEDEDGRASMLPDQLPEDGIALGEEARKHIDTLFDLLDVADYYELLGVRRDVSKSDIKAAYYRIGPGLHPDKHFRKEIGPFKAKIERIFSLLTKAHDTLRYNKQRQSYDASLPPPRPGAQSRRDAVAAAAAYFGGPAERRSGARRTSSSFPRASHAAPQSSPPPARGASPIAPASPPMSPGPGVAGRPPTTSRPRGTGRPGETGRPGGTGRPAGTGRPPAAPASPPPTNPPAAPSVPQPDGTGAPATAGTAAAGTAGTGPPRRVAPPPPTEAELRAQRATLARKLRHRGASPVVTSKRPPQPVTPKVTQREPLAADSKKNVDRSAAETLRDRYQSIALAAQQRRLDRYLDQGRVATAAGDHSAAAAAYAQAHKLSPDDAEIAELAERSANLATQMG